MTRTTTTARVYRHSTGELLGRIQIDGAEAERYADGEHGACQWPEGIAAAGDLLSDSQREACGGLAADVTIYLEV